MLTYLVLVILGVGAWSIGTAAAGGAVMILLPILPFFISPAQAIPAIALGSLIANPYRALLFIKSVNWPIGSWMMSGSLLGSIIGSYIFVQLANDNIKLLVGLFLVVTGLQYWFDFKTQLLRIPNWGFMPLSCLVSLLSAIVGGAGPVYNPFLAAKDLSKEAIVATKSVNSLLMQLSKLFGYAFFGAFNLSIGAYGIAIGVGALIEVYCGKRFLHKLNHQQFKKMMAAVMVCSGLVFCFK